MLRVFGAHWIPCGRLKRTLIFSTSHLKIIMTHYLCHWKCITILVVCVKSLENWGMLRLYIHWKKTFQENIFSLFFAIFNTGCWKPFFLSNWLITHQNRWIEKKKLRVARIHCRLVFFTHQAKSIGVALTLYPIPYTYTLLSNFVCISPLLVTTEPTFCEKTLF